MELDLQNKRSENNSVEQDLTKVASEKFNVACNLRNSKLLKILRLNSFFFLVLWVLVVS